MKILWQVQKSWCKNLSWRKTSLSQSVANQLIETFNSFFKTNIQFSQWGQKICEVAFKPLYSHLDLMIVWISKHCGRTLRGVRGVKRSEILWGIQKYSLPGQPSTHHWVKSKTMYYWKTSKMEKKNHELIIGEFFIIKNYFLTWKLILFFCNFFYELWCIFNGFLFYSILAGWSTWKWVFLNF